MQSLIGLLFFLCLLPLPAVKLPDSFPLLPTLAIRYLGVGVTMLSFLLYNFAVRSVPASRTGAFLNLVPVLTLFMGMVFLDARLTAGQWAASALVFGGVILSPVSYTHLGVCRRVEKESRLPSPNAAT